METTKEKISKLEKAIASPATPENIKMSMENVLYDLKEKLAEEMSPIFTDYKGEQIMYEPHNREYFVIGNDEKIFKSMEEAKQFIDSAKYKSLENTTIRILEAKTMVNSTSTTSRLEGQEIKLGKIVFAREDGVFFENIIMENSEWRPFLRFDNNEIDLDNVKNSKSKSILIKKYIPIDSSKGVINTEFAKMAAAETKEDVIEKNIKKRYSEDELKSLGYEILKKVEGKGSNGFPSWVQRDNLINEFGEDVQFFIMKDGMIAVSRVKSEIQKGIEVEQEHKETLDKVAAGEITVPQAIEETAKTHIEENPKYYDELEKIEGGDKVEAAMQVQFDLIKEELAKGKDKSKHVLSVASMQIIKMLKENPSLYPFYVEKYLDLPKSVRDDLNPFSEQFGGIESPIMKWLKEQNKNVFDVVKVEEYSLPKTKVIHTKPDDKNFMDIHSDFIGSDNLRPVMMGTHFDENGIVSTNAHIMLITPYRGDSDKLEGNFCHTKKCIEEWKSKEIPSKTGEFQNRFPNWKVVIPLSNTEYNMNAAAVYDFIKNATTYELMHTDTRALVFKYGEEKIGFNSNFMLTCIQAMSELGHKELSIAISSSSRAALIIPKGKLQDVNNIKTDFALLMPVLSNNITYFGEFNFETSCYTDPNELTYCFDVEKTKIKKAEKKVKQLEKKIEELTSAIEPMIKEKEFPSPVGYGTFKVVKGIFEGTEFFGRVDGDRVINEDSIGQSFPIANVKRIGYELGEGWSADFDFEGLLRTALKANTSWSIEDLKKLHYSFEDNNYHTLGKPLWEAIKSNKLGASLSEKLHLHDFHEAVQKELDEYLSPDEEGVEIDPNTLQPVKNLHEVNMSEYPKVQLKGDNRAFWYVVRSEGDKYILVFEEKIDDWKSASNIEKYEYYEEIGNKEDYEPYTQVQTEEDDKASWEELKELAEAMISVTKGKEKKEWIEAKELAEVMLAD
jgi:hypothetical protein